MNNNISAKEKQHLAKIKEMSCGVCNQSGPSDAHHIVQHYQYTAIPLCKDCHQGSHNGIHGRRSIWQVMKKDEMTVLNNTIQKLLKGNHG